MRGSSQIVEWHFEHIQSRAEERLVFFYCSGKEGLQTKTLEVLHSLIAQLAESIDGVSVSGLIEKRYKNGNRNSIEIHECPKLLADLASEYQNTTIVIDALDECQDSEALLLNLQEVSKRIRAASKAVKLLFSSRNQVDVDYYFPSCETLRLEHIMAARKEDMVRFVHTQVKEREILRLGSRLLKGKHPDLEDRVINVLVKHSQGMQVASVLLFHTDQPLTSGFLGLCGRSFSFNCSLARMLVGEIGMT